MNDSISAMTSMIATQLQTSSIDPAVNSTNLNGGLTSNAPDAIREVSLFEAALSRAEAAGGVEPVSDGALAAVKPLDYINNEAAEIYDYAKTAVESGNDLTPSEVVMLTARSHEFMFHCQLTANVANRTSDGIQQLFRQQS